MEWARHHPWRVVVVVVVMVAFSAAGIWVFRARETSRGPGFRYDVTAVDRGEIQAKVTATGTVNPIKTVQVGSQVSARIQELGADFNSVVEPGQIRDVRSSPQTVQNVVTYNAVVDVANPSASRNR